MMLHNGDVFATRLERGFFGAFRVLKTGGRFDFSKEEFFLIALTSYVDAARPGISDPRLRIILREQRFNCNGQPHIHLYMAPATLRNIRKHFEYLGNIPLTKEEELLPVEIGDGTDGGFPWAGAIEANFGYEAFLEWRWENEKEAYIEERKEFAARDAAMKAERKAHNLAAAISESTMEAFRYKDEKSDKFWRVEYAGTDLAVNYGKTGTHGQYRVKEFCSAEECAKEALKLIAAKEKKGYRPYREFDRNAQFYFDDDCTGPHPLSSHPNFRQAFTEEFYYDCVDEEAPFGSDEGAETLLALSDILKKRQAPDFSAFPKKFVERDGSMTYIPVKNLDPDTVSALLDEDEDTLVNSDLVTSAAAFAQIKITGRVDADLKKAALKALRRMEIAAQALGWDTAGTRAKTIRDLQRFC